MNVQTTMYPPAMEPVRIEKVLAKGPTILLKKKNGHTVIGMLQKDHRLFVLFAKLRSLENRV